MFKFKRIFPIVIISFLAVNTLWGQEQEKERLLSLSLEQARIYALEHNTLMQNASIEVKRAQAARWQTIASMLPQASASLEYSNMLNYKMNLANFQISMPSSGTLNLTASMTVSGAQIVGAVIGDISLEMTNTNLKKTEQTIIKQVTTTYMSILAMEQTIGLLDSSYENIKKLQSMTENAVEVGALEPVAADQISVQVASLTNSINNTRRSVEMLYNALRLQLGTAVDADITLTQTLDELINEQTALALLQTDLDLNNNYDYQLLVKSTELSQKQVTLAAMDFVPSITGFYQHSAKKYFSDEPTMNMTPPHMLGATLNIPLFSSGRRAAAVAEKKLAYQAAQNTMNNTEDQLRVQDKQLRFNLTSAYENFQVQRKNIDVIDRVFASVSNKYEQGVASAMEITTASNDVIAAQSNYISSLIDFINAQLELQNLLNK